MRRESNITGISKSWQPIQILYFSVKDYEQSFFLSPSKKSGCKKNGCIKSGDEPNSKWSFALYSFMFLLYAWLKKNQLQTVCTPLLNVLFKKISIALPWWGGGLFSLKPPTPPLWIFQFLFILYFKRFGLWEPTVLWNFVSYND